MRAIETDDPVHHPTVMFSKKLQDVHIFDAEDIPAFVGLDAKSAARVYSTCLHPRKNSPCRCEDPNPNICSRCCQGCIDLKATGKQVKATTRKTDSHYSCGHPQKNGPCRCLTASGDWKNPKLCKRCCQVCSRKTGPKISKHKQTGNSEPTRALLTCGANHNQRFGKCACEPKKEGICKRCCQDCATRDKESVPNLSKSATDNTNDDDDDNMEQSTPWLQKLNRNASERTKEAIST
jgi:hypothetical protein